MIITRATATTRFAASCGIWLLVTDGIGIESQGIIDLMRGTHGGSVCDYRHALIHNGNRDLEFRIRSFLIDREIFFTVNDHVVIIRTAPLDIGSYFAVFHSDQKSVKWHWLCRFHLPALPGWNTPHLLYQEWKPVQQEQKSILTDSRSKLPELQKSFSYFFPHLNSIIFIIPQLKLIVNTSLKKLSCFSIIKGAVRTQHHWERSEQWAQ